MDERRRLRIAGIHHITLICKSVDRSAAFYRNLLGMRIVKQTMSEDDRRARHLFFGDEEGRPGTLVTCLEYPQLEQGSVGIGSTHHFALAVASEDELRGWRDYLTSQGVMCTDVMDRTFFKSIYLCDPDGHIVELASTGPAIEPDEHLDERFWRLEPARIAASRPPGEQRERCHICDKDTFKDENDAWDAVYQSRRRFDLGQAGKFVEPLDHAYYEPRCGAWHVSSQPR